MASAAAESLAAKHNAEVAEKAVVGVGHNSAPGVAKDRLKAFIERIERMTEEKDALAADIRDIYAEAKGNGFDVKALRAIVRLRKQDADERREHEAIVDTYRSALGMLD